MFDNAYTPEKADCESGCAQTTTEDGGTIRRSVPALTLNEIQMLAYAKWVAAGKPEGDSMRFWLEAEQQLLHERSKPCHD